MIDLGQSPTRSRLRIQPHPHRLFGQYEHILSQLRCLGVADGQAPRAIGVLALESGDGATSIAANLANVAAQSGDESVLLVDANPARPALHGIFGIPSSPGFIEAMTGAADPLACTHATRIPGLSVMPCSPVDKGALPSISPAALAEQVDALQQAFDITFVDLPAAGESGLAFTLAKGLTGVVLVLQAERTRRSAALRIKRQLEYYGVNILGAVLNKRRHHVPTWLYRSF